MYGLWAPDAELTKWLGNATREEIYNKAAYYFAEKEIAPALFLCDQLAIRDATYTKALILKARACEYINNSRESISLYENALNAAKGLLPEDDPNILIAQNALAALMPIKDPNYDLLKSLSEKAESQLEQIQMEGRSEDDEIKKIKTLPIGMQYAYLLFTLDGIINIDGFEHYFAESSIGLLYPETVQALTSIGARKHADLLELAYEAYMQKDSDQLTRLTSQYESCDVNGVSWHFADYARKSPEAFQ